MVTKDCKKCRHYIAHLGSLGHGNVNRLSFYRCVYHDQVMYEDHSEVWPHNCGGFVEVDTSTLDYIVGVDNEV